MGIVEDIHPFKVVLKSAQCGISEIHVAEAIHAAIYNDRNILYTMPAGEQMQQFVDARARNAIETNDFLRRFVTGTLNLKKFSLNHHQIYFRGVQKRRQIISVDVSSLFLDELDVYEDGTVATLEKRLGATSTPIKRYFSTPSFHGLGISLYYYGSDYLRQRGSDQRVWTIKCDACGKWNEDLHWIDNVIDLNEKDAKFSFYTPNVVVVCRYCRQRIDRLSSNAEWVAKVTENSDYCHGYHISKLFSPLADLNKLWESSKSFIEEQEFWNSDLGLPYEPKGSRVTRSMIDSCRGSHVLLIKSNIPTFMGVDIGQKIHVITAYPDENKRIKVVSAEELDKWSDLPAYYREFNCHGMMIDMNPDKDEAMEFQAAHDNVYLAFFSQHLERTKDRFTLDSNTNLVQIHRTLMMMYVADAFAGKIVNLPLNIEQVRNFYIHLCSPIKATKEDVLGNPIIFYPKTKDPDHFYFCMLYLMLAIDIGSKQTIWKIVKTMMV